jgi:hypothetical protein
MVRMVTVDKDHRHRVSGSFKDGPQVMIRNDHGQESVLLAKGIHQVRVRAKGSAERVLLGELDRFLNSCLWE